MDGLILWISETLFGITLFLLVVGCGFAAMYPKLYLKVFEFAKRYLFLLWLGSMVLNLGVVLGFNLAASYAGKSPELLAVLKEQERLWLFNIPVFFLAGVVWGFSTGIAAKIAHRIIARSLS